MAELGGHFGDHLLRLLKVGRIGGIGFDLVAKGLDFGHRLLGGFVDNQIREGNVCTFGCILEGNRFSDATGRSGNEGDLSV